MYARGKFEREANEFAAELLIDENELDEFYLENCSIDQLALCYGVPIELIKYKFKEDL